MIIKELLDPSFELPNHDVVPGNKRKWHINLFANTVKYFNEYGYGLLGAGIYGMAFYNKSKPTTVLKIYNPRDKAYTRFYSIAKRSNNIHFPKVSKMGYLDIPVNEEKNFRAYMVVTEKLEMLPESYNSMLADIIGYVSYDEFADNEWFKKFPHLQEACDIIKSLVHSDAYQNDIDERNIMVRGTIPVFVDPIHNKPEITR